MKVYLILAIFLPFVTVYLLLTISVSAQQSPYIYSCFEPGLLISPTVSFSPTLIPPPNLTTTFAPGQTLSLSPTQVISPTPMQSPTQTVSDTCRAGSKTLVKGEGICDERTNAVNLCEGNNQMVAKQNYCGTGRVCRNQTNSNQIKCEAVCQLRMGTGDIQTKADLVALAEDYKSHDEFITAVDKGVMALTKTNLGPERLGKINVWALLDLNQSYFQGFNCPTPKGSLVACWNYAKAAQYALSTCGGDIHLILNNDTHRIGSVGGIAIWGSAYIYNFAFDYPTVPHELGHAMAGLSDEYSFGIAALPGTKEGINCAPLGSSSQTTPCPKWAARFPNTGCYPRCGYTNFFRPMQKSIMDRGGANASYDFNEPSLVDGWDEVLKYFN